jgi:prefoldin subunit 5
VQSKEVPFTLEDRDRLIQIETELKALSKSVDVRFDEANRRVDTRFDETNKRIDEINRKIDMLFNFLWIISGVFTTITVATIGFAIWDRRTAIKPLDDRVRKIEDKEKVFIDALKKLAERDRELFELLKKYNLL